MTKKIHISQNSTPGPAEIYLPASKSISNRTLIIDKLGGGGSTIKNISRARDTELMQDLLNSDEEGLDAMDAGTTMRFLTAYLSIGNGTRTLTGTPRMQERPVHILVDTLNELGANIEYLGKNGYPPLKIKPFRNQQKDYIEIPGNVSSQYISALMMVAPVLGKGLTLKLTGKVGSRPYIKMTQKVMEAFGVEVQFSGSDITISNAKYRPTQYEVEPDWSAASYWYSIAALSSSPDLKIKQLKKTSIQGDSAIRKIMEELGVDSVFIDDGLYFEKQDHKPQISRDFSDIPDLAQTVAVICSATGVKCRMTGLESLRIKETDRIAALQNELAKLNASFEENNGEWVLTPGALPEGPVEFNTYEDHRMAMALAPLACKMDIIINDPDVVVKSYPGFWNDLEKAGFNIRVIS